MEAKTIFDEVVSILSPFVKNRGALATVANETSILKDLRVNSARLVEVLIRIQDRFGIDLGDDEADKVRTIGDAVTLIARLKAGA